MNICGKEYHNQGRTHICFWKQGHKGTHNGPEVQWEDLAQWTDAEPTKETETIMNKPTEPMEPRCPVVNPRTGRSCEMAHNHEGFHGYADRGNWVEFLVGRPEKSTQCPSVMPDAGYRCELHYGHPGSHYVGGGSGGCKTWQTEQEKPRCAATRKVDGVDMRCIKTIDHVGSHSVENRDNQMIQWNDSDMGPFCGRMDPSSKKVCKLYRDHSIPHDWEKAQDQATEAPSCLVCGQWYPIEDHVKLPVGEFLCMGWAGESRITQAHRVESGWEYLYAADEKYSKPPTHFVIIKGPKAPDPFEAWWEKKQRFLGTNGVGETDCRYVEGRITSPAAARAIWKAAKEAK